MVTGCILDAGDPSYRGLQIPLRVWKVAAWVARGENRELSLAVTGYVLDQSPQLSDVDLETARARALRAGDPPPLGAYRTYQAPISAVARLTRLDLGRLADADRFVSVSGVRRVGEWIELEEFGDMAL